MEETIKKTEYRLSNYLTEIAQLIVSGAPVAAHVMFAVVLKNVLIDLSCRDKEQENPVLLLEYVSGSDDNYIRLSTHPDIAERVPQSRLLISFTIRGFDHECLFAARRLCKKHGNLVSGDELREHELRLTLEDLDEAYRTRWLFPELQELLPAVHESLARLFGQSASTTKAQMSTAYRRQLP